MPVDYTKIKELQSVPCGRGMLACRFDPAGTTVAVAGMDFQINVVRLAEGKLSAPVKLSGHQSWVAALAWHPQGRWLYSGDYAGKICCWDTQAETPTLVWTESAHHGWIRWLAVSPDGKHLASAGNDLVVRLWTAMDARQAREFAGHETHIYSVAFHPAEPVLVSGDLKGTLRHWDLETGQLVREIALKEMFVQQQQLRLGGIRCLAFSRDAQWLAAGGMSGFGSIGDGIGAPTSILVDWKTGEPKQTCYPKEAARTFLMGVAIHNDGFILGATGGLDRGYFLVWKIGQMEKESAFQLKLPESAWSMDLNASQDRIITASHDGALRLYELPPA